MNITPNCFYVLLLAISANYRHRGIQELELLEEDKKKTLFDLMDTYIRDAKTRQAYATR